MPDEDESAFHAGERAVQQRAGVRTRAEMLGGMYRPFMTEQHREFFQELPFVLVGSLDREGRPWASWLHGAPGFVHAPDDETLTIDAAPLPADPLHDALRHGARLGVLGIQLHTRRRNRLNGYVVQHDARSFSLRVDQSFGNCPKYITARAPVATPASEDAQALPTQEAALLSERARACIADADTCFIASASGVELDAADAREGVDVSHRGGKPGFVHVRQGEQASVLTMPDFAGNNAFNTLGNVERYARAGYLFPSFDAGDLLMVTGRTEIIWDGPELQRFRGAQRLLRLHVESGLYFSGALPFRWSKGELAPQLPKTGSWQEALDESKTP